MKLCVSHSRKIPALEELAISGSPSVLKGAAGEGSRENSKQTDQLRRSPENAPLDETPLKSGREASRGVGALRPCARVEASAPGAGRKRKNRPGGRPWRSSARGITSIRSAKKEWS